jgi:hypothetical protein
VLFPQKDKFVLWRWPFIIIAYPNASLTVAVFKTKTWNLSQFYFLFFTFYFGWFNQEHNCFVSKFTLEQQFCCIIKICLPEYNDECKMIKPQPCVCGMLLQRLWTHWELGAGSSPAACEMAPIPWSGCRAWLLHRRLGTELLNTFNKISLEYGTVELADSL